MKLNQSNRPMAVSPINHRKWITLTVILFLVPFSLFAQLKANFSASAVSGCAPVVVQFTDLSTGNPTQWQWDLGNGVTSSLQHPSATYFNPGTYHIKLVVKKDNNGDSLVKSEMITVHPNPVVQLNASDSAGCFPFPVQFTDQTTTATGTLQKWQWDFGDGKLSSEKDPLHVYHTAGNFTVALHVTNSFGCSQTLTKSQFIKVTDGVTAGFTNNVIGSCKAPVTVNFTNTSTGPGALTYLWNFGDGSQSTDKNPSHTYTQSGSFTVYLVTISPQGCIDTIRKESLISIGSVASNFTVPAAICEGNPFTITNTSSPKPATTTWTFGDGTTATAFEPVKTFSTSGTYTIKMVNDFGGCKDSITRNITVYKKTKPDFTANQTTACMTPFTVNFSNKTTGTNTYQWIFGDGGTSTAANPAYTYTKEGKYSVTLIATNQNGCSDTLVKKDFIVIQKPVITISGLGLMGCVPITASPKATIAITEPVTGYLWDFGDGTTSTAAAPQHTYANEGNYTISLTITTGSGCSNTVTMVNAVRAGTKPKVNFTINPNDVCAVKPVFFVDASTPKVDMWYWEFGDGGKSTIQNPKYEYQDTGWFDVSLIAWNNTCPDTLLVKKAVHIMPPIAAYRFTNSCTEKYTKVFTDRSIGANTWFWDFGDGTTSAQQNPTHTYKTKGTYKVLLKVTNGSCEHSSEQTVKVIDEKALFNADNKFICKGGTVTFTSAGIDANEISKWQWDFGNGNTSTVANKVTQIFTKPGTYTVTLRITDKLGCVDTKTEVITVYGPTASFVNNSGVCLGSDIVFTDSSKTDGTNALVKWIWNYGDNTSDTLTAGPFKHLYAKAGTYTVTLRVEDNFGCFDQVSKSGVVVAQPKASFYSPDSISCISKNVRFVNQSTANGPSYKWSFGNGATSAVSNPTYQYSQIGVYDVTLLVTDKFGCKDSLVRPTYINISLPKASFTMSDSASSCPPLLVKFTSTATNYKSVKWYFGDGNTSEIDNPSHLYTRAGIFYAKMVVTGPGGCMDSISKKIEIKGPSGSFTYTPVAGCVPLTVKFTANTINGTSFVWDYSDGNTYQTQDSSVQHTYKETGNFLPKLIIKDGLGCSVPIFGKDTIFVGDVTASFEMNKTQFCDSGLVTFKNTSISNDLITNWQWSFGDGGTSTAREPDYRFIRSGNFTAQLIVTTKNGCKDTVRASQSVAVFESPVIAIAGDTLACAPAQIALSGKVIKGDAGLLKWNWNLGNGQTSAQQIPLQVLYANAGGYNITLSATDTNGCQSNAAKAVTIHPVPVTRAGQESLVCRGSTLQLNATGAVTYSWKADSTLSCINCANPVISPVDGTIYTVTGTNQFGCSATDSVKINVRQHFQMNVSPGDTICAGTSVFISADGADKYSWYPSTGLDNAGLSRPKAQPQTTTLYRVVGRDNDNCFTDTATVFIKVNPMPQVDAGADVTMSSGGSVQLKTTSSPDVISWRWTPNSTLNCADCPNPVAVPRQQTRYVVEVENDGGCKAVDDITVSVICNSGNFFIPNTFSPNQDGKNDVFYPRGTGISTIRLLRVYSRWGEVLFERRNFNANDAASGWDGTFKGQKLAPDVYVYLCEVICDNNEVIPFKGDVTLIQ